MNGAPESLATITELGADGGLAVIGGGIGRLKRIDGGNGADSRRRELGDRFHGIGYPFVSGCHFFFAASSSNSAMTPGSTDSLYLTGTARAVTR